MKSTELIKELLAAGCELKRHRGGSHQIWWSPSPTKPFLFHTLRMIYLWELSNPLRKWQGYDPATGG